MIYEIKEEDKKWVLYYDGDVVGVFKTEKEAKNYQGFKEAQENND